MMANQAALPGHRPPVLRRRFQHQVMRFVHHSVSTFVWLPVRAVVGGGVGGAPCTGMGGVTSSAGGGGGGGGGANCRPPGGNGGDCIVLIAYPN